jgi:hypothetical protein
MDSAKLSPYFEPDPKSSANKLLMQPLVVSSSLCFEYKQLMLSAELHIYHHHHHVHTNGA